MSPSLLESGIARISPRNLPNSSRRMDMKNKAVSMGCVRKVRRQKTSANYLRIYKNAGVTVGGFSNAHDAPKHRQVSFSTGFTGLLGLGSAGRLLLPSAKVSCDMSERSGRACPLWLPLFIAWRTLRAEAGGMRGLSPHGIRALSQNGLAPC